MRHSVCSLFYQVTKLVPNSLSGKNIIRSTSPNSQHLMQRLVPCPSSFFPRCISHIAHHPTSKSLFRLIVTLYVNGLFITWECPEPSDWWILLNLHKNIKLPHIAHMQAWAFWMKTIKHLSTLLSIIYGPWFSLNSHINATNISISYPHYPLLQQTPTPWSSSASSVALICPDSRLDIPNSHVDNFEWTFLLLFIISLSSIISLLLDPSASVVTSTSSSPCAIHNQFQSSTVSSVAASLHHRHRFQSINRSLVLSSSLSPTQPLALFYHQSHRLPLCCLSVVIVSIKPQSHDFWRPSNPSMEYRCGTSERSESVSSYQLPMHASTSMPPRSCIDAYSPLCILVCFRHSYKPISIGSLALKYKSSKG